MKKNIEKHIKNKVFESCEKIYNAELLYCEGVNGFNKNEINEANKWKRCVDLNEALYLIK